MKRILLLIAAWLLMSAGAVAQQIVTTPGPNEVVLGEVKAMHEYDHFRIRYSIVFGEQVKECVISLYVSFDGGAVFASIPVETGVTGDVGRIRRDGEKEIIYTLSMDFMRRLVDRRIVFKVSVSDIVFKGEVSEQPEGIFVGTPSIVTSADLEMAVSLPVECRGDAQISWKGICYSETEETPTFMNASVKRFLGDERAEGATLRIGVTPGQSYYLRGIAAGVDGQIAYGETIFYTVPAN